MRDFFNPSTVGHQMKYPNTRYPDASVYGRFYGTDFFFILFCLIYQEFCVPDPNNLLLSQNTVKL